VIIPEGQHRFAPTIDSLNLLARGIVSVIAFERDIECILTTPQFFVNILPKKYLNSPILNIFTTISNIFANTVNCSLNFPDIDKHLYSRGVHDYQKRE
jgi:hypothetical protein